MNPKLNTITTIGSTLNPALSSVYKRNIVPEDPPAPAARVLDGRVFLTVSLWSAAARRRIAERGPPGGEAARAMLEDVPLVLAGVSVPESAETGEEGRSAWIGVESVLGRVGELVLTIFLLLSAG